MRVRMTGVVGQSSQPDGPRWQQPPVPSAGSQSSVVQRETSGAPRRPSTCVALENSLQRWIPRAGAEKVKRHKFRDGGVSPRRLNGRRRANISRSGGVATHLGARAAPSETKQRRRALRPEEMKSEAPRDATAPTRPRSLARGHAPSLTPREAARYSAPFATTRVQIRNGQPAPTLREKYNRMLPQFHSPRSWPIPHTGMTTMFRPIVMLASPYTNSRGTKQG